MTSRTTRTIGLASIVFVAVSMLLASWLAWQNSLVQPRQIVVVGSVDAPHVAELQLNLQCRVTGGCQGEPGGDKLVSSFNWLSVVVFATIGLVLVSAGSLILSRQPRNWAGWIFLFLGMSFAGTLLAQEYVVYAVKHGALLPLGAIAVLGEIGLLPIVVFPLLILLFPDGHTPGPRWRLAVWGLLGGSAVAALTFLLKPGPLNNYVNDGVLFVNPLGVTDIDTYVGPVATIAVLAAVFSAIAVVPAVFLRYRRSRGEERQQLRLLALVGLIAVILFVLATVSGAIVLQSERPGQISLPDVFLALMALTVIVGIPAAYVIAIFRYGLWDLDVVVKKTVLYVVVAIVFFGLFALAILVVSGLIGLTGALDSDAGSTVAAVAIGIFVWPAALVARRVADRVVYGGRATPYEVLTGFTGRIGDTYASDDVLQRMAQVLAEGTGASSASVQLRVGAELRELASFGTRTGEESTAPVTLHGDAVGALIVTMPTNDPMNPAKDRLLSDLATQAGPVLRNVQLIEELRASRQRLVAAQDEERRKLERNIHDGVQQQLVALAVRLKLADTMVDRDPAKAHEALASLQADAGTALEDLRDLARGIYPPLLADRGLGVALEAQARKAAVPTTVDAEGVGRYDQGVEAAVYFCTLEALNNVAKYANASQAVVRLAQVDGVLRFEVRDNGTGFDLAVARTGTGLQGMTDRLDAIGGELHIESDPSAGTLVSGSVPATAT